MRIRNRFLSLLLAVATVLSMTATGMTSYAAEAGRSDLPGVTLELGAETLKQGGTERLFILGNDFPVDGIQYAVAEKDQDKIEVDQNGNVRIKNSYGVAKDETATVTATIQYYDREDVLFYEDFEPKAANAKGDLTEKSEYGRFQFNDWGTAGYTQSERAYTITDTSRAEGGQASRTGRYGVTQRDSKASGLQGAYTVLENPQAGTFTFWYYDSAAVSIASNETFCAGIPFTPPVADTMAGIRVDNSQYVCRVSGGNWAKLGARSEGWHKFEFRVDAESGTTLWLDGKETSYRKANLKAITNIALGTNWAGAAKDTPRRHFIDDMYAVKAGAQTKEAVLSVEIPLEAASALLSAIPAAPITAAGGSVLLNLSGIALTGRKLQATVDGKTYDAVVKSATEAEVTVELPKNNTTEAKTYVVTFTLDGAACDCTAELIVPAKADPTKNIAPEAVKATATNVFGNNTTYAAEKAIDGKYNTRWASASKSTAPLDLTLEFAAPQNVYKAGINSFDSRITGFSIEYWDGQNWTPAYTYSGSAVPGVYSGASSDGTVYFGFTPQVSSQWRLHMTSFTNDPTIWEFELYAAPEGMAVLSGAEPAEAITADGGQIVVNLSGLNLQDAAIQAVVNGKTYIAESISETAASVTVELPKNESEWDRKYQVAFVIDGEPADYKAELTVPAGKAATDKLWLQYTSPAPAAGMSGYGSGGEGYRNWQNWTLPIGNGYQGANLYGLVDRELMQLSEESLWTGGFQTAEKKTYSDAAAIGAANKAGDYPNEKGSEIYRNAREAGLQVAGATTPPDNASINQWAKQLFPSGREALGNYQSFAEVFYEFQHEGKTVSHEDVNNYRRWLDIENAVSGVSYTYENVGYTRESFASYPARVIVTRIAADQPGKVRFTLNPTVPHLSGKENVAITADAASKTIDLSGALKQNGLRFAARLQIITDGTVTAGKDQSGNGTLCVDGADEAVVIISLGTDYVNDYDKRYRTGEDPMTAVADRLEAAASKGYDALRAEHIADYQSIFNHVTLDLGGQPTNADTDELLSTYRADNNITSERPAALRYLEELYFQYGRYLLIASSRQGTLPANLQGVWNRESAPMWQSDYHLNINLQMNYWPANNTNMRDTLYALVDYMESLRKPGREVAYRVYGVGDGDPDTATGWVAHVSSNPFGFTGFHNTKAGDSGGYPQYSPESAMWMMQNIYNMYQYYPDTAYLRDHIYPIMREAALFYSDPEVLVEDPASGRMVMSPTYSSEHGPMWGGDTFQQQLLWQLFTDVIEASEILDVDGEDGGLREKLERLLPRLSADGDDGPVPIGNTSGKDASGQTAPGVKEWWWETGYITTASGKVPTADASHRHLSHLVGLFPGSLITKDTTAWMEAAIGSLTARGDGATGWSRGMKTNLWARTGDGNHAYKIFDGLIAEATLNNLWDYHSGPYFQIDGNLGGTAGMIEMLMQSHAGYIEPLPALPDAWPNGTVTGITMRGGFTVDMTWANKTVTSLQVTSTAGQACAVKYLDQNGEPLYARVTRDGRNVDVTYDDNGVSTFATEKDGVYSVTFGPKPEAHKHVFDQKNTDGKYLKLEATCAGGAVYYYSCECGEVGADTFIYGEANPENHSGPYEVRNAQEATTEHAGYTGDRYCVGCETVVERGQVIDKLPEPEKPVYPVYPVRPAAPSTPAGNDTLPFVDVRAGSDWFYEDVKYVCGSGLMNGVDQMHFAPNATLTRGMLVTILYRMEGEPSVHESGAFTDVDAGSDWFGPAVEWAAGQEIVKGYSDGSFGPNDAITREQLAAVLFRYAGGKGFDISARAALSQYGDAATVSSYGVEAMRWAVAEGLVNGSNGSLMPQASATRAQVAAIIRRFQSLG